jgi:hypothetical protein
VPVIGARRTAISIVTERHEWTGGRAVHAGQPSLSHQRDDTRPIVERKPAARRAFDTLASGFDTLLHLA